jgi:hypothetical protein
MQTGRLWLRKYIGVASNVVFLLGCSGESSPAANVDGTGGETSTGGSAAGVPGAGGSMNASGRASSSSGGVPASGGAPASGGMRSPGGKGGASSGEGGGAGSPSSGGQGGVPPSGGSSGAGGGGATGGNGAGDGPPIPPLDCGAEGWAVENNGPPKNRVNYLILADGYTATSVETTLKTHIQNALKRRFEHESGEPYGRYRKFVNICVMKAISQSEGIGNGPTAFDGGNGGDRLAKVNQTKVNDYIKAKVPASFEVDWKAVVLNQNRWENTGAALMLWSGAHADAPGAALHEGGHGFHQLADEYGSSTGCKNEAASCNGNGTAYGEMNSAGNCTTTDDKWNLWLGTTQKGLKLPDMGATGLQQTWLGSRYVGTGQYRPSCNSMMNSLFGSNVNTSFNSVSREQIIFTIWRAVVPIDSTVPPAGAVNDPGSLTVNVIDPAVIDVDWTVDGTTRTKAGTTFSTASLAPGTHTISARAYDNASTDLVKLRTGKCPASVTGRYCSVTSWPRSTQTVTWTVTKP